MTGKTYHNPVLLRESIDALSIDPNGIYIDATFGGGGHSQEILNHLSKGHLYAFDQDPDALNNVPDNEHFSLIPQNFKFLKNFMRAHNAIPVNGILADFGVSSHQFDQPERGFSIRYDGPLDMRMNTHAEKTAADVLNEYEESDLADVFYNYGEIKSSRKLASAIVQQRNQEAYVNSKQLMQTIEPFTPVQKRNQFQARVFQALRIEVNDELQVLKDFLEQSADILAPGGRIACITYHSLEDRLVKNFFKAGNFEGKEDKDLFGNIQRPLQPIWRKPVIPSEEEVQENNRARSAKLRCAEKI